MALASVDLRMAELALHDAPPLPGPACFHAQQAAEKALKALLHAHDVPVRRTHDLLVLVDDLPVPAADTDELARIAGPIANFGVGPRYPQPLIPATLAEALGAERAALWIVGWVEGRLGLIT